MGGTDGRGHRRLDPEPDAVRLSNLVAQSLEPCQIRRRYPHGQGGRRILFRGERPHHDRAGRDIGCGPFARARHRMVVPVAGSPHHPAAHAPVPGNCAQPCRSVRNSRAFGLGRMDGATGLDRRVRHRRTCRPDRDTVQRPVYGRCPCLRQPRWRYLRASVWGWRCPSC